VNLGDIASSVQNLQLQRGVGTSTNGAGAFGASINILTDSYSEEPYGEISNSYGSFNTHKHTLKFSTGLFDEHFEFAGRASLIKSDGYVDRATSELKSYFLQGTYVDDNTQIKALLFGGKETTYQSWFGIGPDRLKNDRTFNPAGRYTDENGDVKFYDNQTDNYRQDHAQLLWNQTYNSNWSSNVAFHYTYGRGYYEEYQEDAPLNQYGLENFMTEGQEKTQSDLVNRSWLKNNFYGTTFSLNYRDNKVDAVLGGAWNRYDGDHFGRVIYTRFAKNNDPFDDYYFNNADKTDFNIYAKATISITNDFAVYGDLQYRRISYENKGMIEEGVSFPINSEFNFFNPKAGLTYELNRKNQFYFSFAVAQREPTRTDFESALLSGNNYPDAERLNDYEMGWRFKAEKSQINANLYYMDYKDQLVLTGEIDDEGARVRENSGKSYRLGLEIDANFQLTEKLSLRPNVALSQNQNIDFFSRVDDEQVNFGNTPIAFSPQIVAGNMIRYQVLENLQLNFLSKFVGEQYMSNIEAEASKLDSYFKSDLNIEYVWDNAPWFESVVFTGLVNNIFDEKYVSNGYYSPAFGPGFYPQAGINYLAGVTLKF
jgi:iron complex outermembrane receptor protein